VISGQKYNNDWGQKCSREWYKSGGLNRAKVKRDGTEGKNDMVWSGWVTKYIN
jgi:hypothetical protein